jgi:hypothetical protein
MYGISNTKNAKRIKIIKPLEYPTGFPVKMLKTEVC